MRYILRPTEWYRDIILLPENVSELVERIIIDLKDYPYDYEYADEIEKLLKLIKKLDFKNNKRLTIEGFNNFLKSTNYTELSGYELQQTKN